MEVRHVLRSVSLHLFAHAGSRSPRGSDEFGNRSPHIFAEDAVAEWITRGAMATEGARRRLATQRRRVTRTPMAADNRVAQGVDRS